MWGKHLSEEHRKKISIANIGIKNPHSLESRLKIGNYVFYNTKTGF
jgi:hypothetical protein